MGYLGVNLKAFQLGVEAAEDAIQNYNLNVEEEQDEFLDECFRNVESYSSSGEYRYGHILKKSKNIDKDLESYDGAISDGIRSVIRKYIKIKQFGYFDFRPYDPRFRKL